MNDSFKINVPLSQIIDPSNPPDIKKWKMMLPADFDENWEVEKTTIDVNNLNPYFIYFIKKKEIKV